MSELVGVMEADAVDDGDEKGVAVVDDDAILDGERAGLVVPKALTDDDGVPLPLLLAMPLPEPRALPLVDTVRVGVVLRLPVNVCDDADDTQAVAEPVGDAVAHAVALARVDALPQSLKLVTGVADKERVPELDAQVEDVEKPETELVAVGTGLAVTDAQALTELDTIALLLADGDDRAEALAKAVLLTEMVLLPVRDKKGDTGADADPDSDAVFEFEPVTEGKAVLLGV